MAPRNRALDPRGLESPGPIFKTLILSLVSFSKLCVDYFRSLPVAPTAASDTQGGAQKRRIAESEAKVEISAQGPEEEWGEASENLLLGK